MTYRRLLLTAAASSLALAACNQQPAAPATGAPIASLPLAQSAPPPETAAPALNALPPAPPLPRAARPKRPAYAYVDDAYRMGDAFADSPPDYTVDYDGERPYVWRSTGGEYRVVEQTPDGQREYFYRGDSDYPFLVRDNRYSYAYDDGELVEVYDSYGRPYPNYAAAEAVIAAQYLARARHLYDAAVHQQRQAAYAGDWRARQGAVLAPQRQWASEQQRNTDWRRMHDERLQQLPPQQRTGWEQERAQRQAYATRTAPLIAAAPVVQRHDFNADRTQADALRRQQADAATAAARQQQLQAEAQRQQQAQAQAQRSGAGPSASPGRGPRSAARPGRRPMRRPKAPQQQRAGAAQAQAASNAARDQQRAPRPRRASG